MAADGGALAGHAGANGVAGDEADSLASNLEPLFECIVREVAPPSVRLESPLQMLVTNLDCERPPLHRASAPACFGAPGCALTLTIRPPLFLPAASACVLC